MELLKELLNLTKGGQEIDSYISADKTRTAKKYHDSSKAEYTVKFFKNGESAGKDYVTDREYQATDMAQAYVDKDENYVKNFIPKLKSAERQHLKSLKEDFTQKGVPVKPVKKESPTDAKLRKEAIAMMRKMGVASKETDKLKTCSIAEVQRQVKLFQRHVAGYRGLK